MNEVEMALKWVESVRHVEGGHSENEKKLIALADEVHRLRTRVKELSSELKLKREAK